MSSTGSYFTGTDDIVEDVTFADPRSQHVECGEDPNIRGRDACWYARSHYVVWVDADKILFTPGNPWNPGHAAGTLASMRDGCCFEPPAARVYRITAADVRSTQAAATRGDLEEEHSMLRPFTKADIGSYRAQLLDGNHRAAAAMALGESRIPVYVSDRTEIRQKDWIRLRKT